MYEVVISGKIVDPIDGIYNTYIGISKGKIEKISENGLEGKETLYLTSSQLLFPGFIDPHVHLREPGWEYKEDFLSGSGAALHGGVTTVGDMPNLPEPIINKQRLLRKIGRARKSVIDILHLGGVNKNNLLDIKEIAPLVSAFKIYTAKSTGELTLNGWPQVEEAVKIISGLRKPITFHCEEQEIIDKAKEEMLGKDYPWKHCDERPAESEISAIQKVLHMCKAHKTKTNIAHISTKDGLDIVRECSDVYYEITPHHIFFTKQNMKDSLLKVNPPLRDKKDAYALLKELKNGACMLATDHAPHTLAEKLSANPPAGMPGLDTYGNFVLWLIIDHKLKLQTAAQITSYNAAKYFGLNDRARIKEGFLADIVILDRKGTATIKNENMETKCGWSPFEGVTFPGSVAATVVHGQVYKK